jgi:hypothetical protein
VSSVRIHRTCETAITGAHDMDDASTNRQQLRQWEVSDRASREPGMWRDTLTTPVGFGLLTEDIRR